MLYEKVCAFLENLTLTDEYKGQQWILREWQKEIIRKIYTPGIETVFLFIPRGCAKTTLVSGLTLFTLVCESPGQVVYSCASDREQAAIVFDKICTMVKADPYLDSILRIYRSPRKVINKLNGNLYIPLSSEKDTKLGYNPSLILADEIISWKDRKVWDDLLSAQGKRKERKAIAISTGGELDPESFCFRMLDYAKFVRENPKSDPSFMPIIYQANKEEDWHDRNLWKRIHPAYGDFWSDSFMEKEYREALKLPDAEFRFRTRYLNQLLDNAHEFIPMKDWDACKQPVNYTGVCHGGLDLSSTLDVSCFTLIFEDYSILPTFFVPEKACEKREKQNKAKIDHWIDAGLIITCPGDTVDYDMIRAKINELNKVHYIEEIGIDRFNAVQLATQLQDDAFKVSYFNQTGPSYNDPCKELQKLILEKRLKHDGNPVARWMMSNLKVKVDPRGYLSPDRKACLDKVDFPCALLMALGKRMLNPGGSVYANMKSLTT